MNVLENTIISTPSGVEDTCAKLTIDDTTLPFIFHNISQADEAYTLSFWARSEAEGSIMVGGAIIATTSEWTKHVVNFIADSVSVPMYFRAAGTYYIYKTQIEIGDHATDYRPAVEDVEEEVEGAKSIAIQTRNMFQWIVKSGDSGDPGDPETNFVLTDRMATLIADTISLNGNVKVDGSMIVDGTLTANKINLTDLFAQDITSTGTIRGVELIGARLEIGDVLTIEKDGRIAIDYDWETTKFEYFTVKDSLHNYVSAITPQSFYAKYTDKDGVNYVGDISSASMYLQKYDSVGILAESFVSAEGINTGEILATGDITCRGTIYGNKTISLDRTGYSDIVQYKLTNYYQSGALYLSENGNLGIFSLTHKNWAVRIDVNGNTHVGNTLVVSTRKAEIASTTADACQMTMRNSLHSGSLYVSEAGNFGLFSHTHSDWAIRMNTDGLVFVNQSIAFRNASSGAGIRPVTDNVVACGGADFKWTKVYAVDGTIQTSDEREKDILDIRLDDYSDLFMDIKPIAYRWKSGETKRIHFGVGAQTLARKFAEHGMDFRDYAVVEHDELEEPTTTGQADRYSMNYQSLQMLTLMQTQKNTRELEKAIDKIRQLEEKIANLERGIG